jgi:hypothetical protein
MIALLGGLSGVRTRYPGRQRTFAAAVCSLTAGIGSSAAGLALAAMRQLSRRQLLGDVAGFAGIEPTRLGSTRTPPDRQVGAQPICEDASGPCIAVEDAEQQNPPLLRLPGRVKPKRLAEQTENARPPAPTFTLVLRKPDREDAAEGDADLI